MKASEVLAEEGNLLIKRDNEILQAFPFDAIKNISYSRKRSDIFRGIWNGLVSVIFLSGFPDDTDRKFLIIKLNDGRKHEYEILLKRKEWKELKKAIK